MLGGESSEPQKLSLAELSVDEDAHSKNKSKDYWELATSRLPVTALHFLSENTILAGIGRSLYVYQCKSRDDFLAGDDFIWERVKWSGRNEDDNCFGLEHLPFERVHHIDSFQEAAPPLTYQVVAAGGKEARGLRFCLDNVVGEGGSLTTRCKACPVLYLQDRIVDALILDRNEPKRTPPEGEGHGKVVFLTAHNCVEIWTFNGELLREIESDRRPDLYAGSLFANQAHSNSHQNSDLLWVAGGTAFGELLLWHLDLRERSTFMTNQGSNVIVHPAHTGPIFDIAWSLDGRRLLTCSDDRSVREHEFTQSPCLDTNSLRLRCSTILWGHRARAWRCLLSSSSAISVGEDATLRVWNLREGGKSKETTVEVFGSRWSTKAHHGLNTWSLALSPSEKTCVTGGQDGAIKSWSLRDEEIKPLEIRDSGGKELAVKACSILTSSVIGLLSYENDISLYDTSTARLSTLPRKTDWTAPIRSMLYVHPKYLLVCSVDSQVGIYDIISESQVGLYIPPENTVLSGVDSVTHEDAIILAAASSTGRWHISKVNVNDGVQTFLVSGEGPAHNSARIFWAHGLYSILAQGACEIFKTRNRGHAEKLASIPTSTREETWRDVVAEWHENTSTLLHLADQVGRIYTFRIEDDVTSRLTLLSSEVVSKGSMERLIPLKSDLWIMSIYKQRIAIRSHVQKRVIWETPLASSRKAWDIKIHEQDDMISPRFVVAYVKQRQIYMVTNSESQSIQGALHGREIRSTKLIHVDSGLLCVTAGEDTTCLLSILRSGGQFQTVSRICLHPSSIRCLELMEDPSTKNLLLFTGGASGCLLCVLVSTDHESERFSTLLLSKAPVPLDESELRILGLSSWRAGREPGQIFVAASYSDGITRIFLFGPSEFKQVIQLPNRGKCLLDLKSVPGPTDTQRILAIGATDGKIDLFAFDSDLRVSPSDRCCAAVFLVRLDAHQSGVNAMSMRQHDHLLEIISGGDDNAVTLHRLRYDALTVLISRQLGTSSLDREFAKDDLPMPWALVFRMPDAHSAAIQGIEFIGSDRAISVAGDQRYILWKNPSGKIQAAASLSIESEGCSQVADPSALSVHETRTDIWVAIAGIGLEVFRVRLETNSNASAVILESEIGAAQ